MNTAIKLAQMGCGSEIVNSAIERGNIHACVSNANSMLSYFKKAVRNGSYTHEDAVCFIMPYYNKLLGVEHLANKYSFLWLEKFSKSKLQMEKFINQ